MKSKIALLQMDVAIGQVEQNYAHALTLLNNSMTYEPDIIVLPEMWNIGFFPTKNLATLCDDEGYQTKELLQTFAAKNKVNIVGGSVGVRKCNHLYNTTYVVNRSGDLVSEYSKVHLFSYAEEDQYFTAGSSSHHFTLDGILCSSMICYDIRFPELARKEALKGMELLFVPAQWPLLRKEHWITLNRARAIENQIYLCAVNGCGCTPVGDSYGGHSLLLNPWGEDLVHLSEGEDITIGTIDLDILQQIRRTMSVLTDRREDVY